MAHGSKQKGTLSAIGSAHDVGILVCHRPTPTGSPYGKARRCNGKVHIQGLGLNRLMTLVSYSVFKGIISPEQFSDYLISKPWFPNHGPNTP